jgi:hypothetical protein
MPDRSAFGQSSTGLKKLMMPELVCYRNKPKQSGFFLPYRIEMTDAVMPIQA